MSINPAQPVKLTSLILNPTIIPLVIVPVILSSQVFSGCAIFEHNTTVMTENFNQMEFTHMCLGSGQ